MTDRGRGNVITFSVIRAGLPPVSCSDHWASHMELDFSDTEPAACHTEGNLISNRSLTIQPAVQRVW